MTAPFQAPYPLPMGGGGWVLSDFLRRTITSPPAPAGQSAVAQGEQLQADVMWLIDHLVSYSTSTKQTTLRLYSGQVGPGFLLDGTEAGNFNVADWPNGLQLEPASSLVAVWSGSTAGTVGTVVVQGRVMRRMN